MAEPTTRPIEETLRRLKAEAEARHAQYAQTVATTFVARQQAKERALAEIESRQRNG